MESGYMEPWERWRFEYKIREEDASGRAPKPAGWLPAEERPPPEGGQRKRADREDLAKRLVTHQHRRSALELHAHRPREGRG